MSKTYYCQVAICEWEAISVVQFHKTGEHLLVCEHCETVVLSVLCRLPAYSYDVTIIPLHDWLGDTEDNDGD